MRSHPCLHHICESSACQYFLELPLKASGYTLLPPPPKMLAHGINTQCSSKSLFFLHSSQVALCPCHASTQSFMPAGTPRNMAQDVGTCCRRQHFQRGPEMASEAGTTLPSQLAPWGAYFISLFTLQICFTSFRAAFTLGYSLVI